MTTYDNEFEQIESALASIVRDFCSRVSFRLGRKQVPKPPDGWRDGNREPPHLDNRLSFWAPWGTAYIVVKYNSECDKWWANYYSDNSFSEALVGGTLLNCIDYGESYDDAIQAALDFMQGDHREYPESRPTPE